MIQIARSFTPRSCAAGAVALAIGLGMAAPFAPAAMARSTAAKVTAPATKNTKATDVPALTTGSVRGEPSFSQRMEECMAIWEPRTHMTKSQWKRSCKTTLQSLTD